MNWHPHALSVRRTPQNVRWDRGLTNDAESDLQDLPREGQERVAMVIPGLSNTNPSAWRSATQIADRRWCLGGKRSRRSSASTDVNWVVAKILRVPLAGQTASRLPAGVELRPPLDWQHAKQ